MQVPIEMMVGKNSDVLMTLFDGIVKKQDKLHSIEVQQLQVQIKLARIVKYNESKEGLRQLDSEVHKLQHELRRIDNKLNDKLCELQEKHQTSQRTLRRQLDQLELEELKLHRELAQSQEPFREQLKTLEIEERRLHNKLEAIFSEAHEELLELQNNHQLLNEEVARAESHLRNKYNSQRQPLALRKKDIELQKQDLQEEIHLMEERVEVVHKKKELELQKRHLLEYLQLLEEREQALFKQGELQLKKKQLEEIIPREQGVVQEELLQDQYESLLLEEQQLQLEKNSLQHELEMLRIRIDQQCRKTAKETKTFDDGIPQLCQEITTSTGRIPPESEHKSCARVPSDKFNLLDVPDEVKNYRNSIWLWANEQGSLGYSTEGDIAHHVKDMLKEISLAAGIELNFRTDLNIRHITPNNFILTQGSRLVCVVEVKKPGEGVLEAPTVLGELYDQMKLLEGFYRSGPVVGIVTTLAEWCFAWFPEDNEHFEAELKVSAFSNSSLNASEDSALSNKPLQKKENWGHVIEVEDGDSTCDYLTARGEERILITSPIIRAHDKFDLVLQYLYSSLIRICQVKWHCWDEEMQRPQCFFMLHRGDTKAITWHSADISFESVKYNNFPRADASELLALEDLGRGSSGKAWLMCSLSKAICVLQFANKKNSDFTTEMQMWHEIYPEFKSMVNVDHWSGSAALMMPHFADIPVCERHNFRDAIEHLLREKFDERNLFHRDVKWRNIGYYKSSSGESLPVLYDLGSVRSKTGNGGDDSEWVQKSMDYLFATNAN